MPDKGASDKKGMSGQRPLCFRVKPRPAFRLGEAGPGPGAVL